MADLTPVNVEAPASGAKLGAGHAGRRVNLVKLAEAQRWLIWCILGRLVVEIGWFGMSGAAGGAWGLPPAVVPIAFVLYFAVQVVCMVLVARLARAYGYNWFMSILGALVTIISCIGLIVLVMLNQRVIATLQRAGAKVGFMGVNDAQMNKLREGVCNGCGYDLRGLLTAVCPECGRVDPRS